MTKLISYSSSQLKTSTLCKILLRQLKDEPLAVRTHLQITYVIKVLYPEKKNSQYSMKIKGTPISK